MPVRATFDLSLLRNGTFDPTTRVVGNRIERATLTPYGPGAIALTADDEVRIESTHGPGGDWLARNASALAARDVAAQPIDPLHDAVRQAQRDVGILHLPRSNSPWHELLPAILGQRITGMQAHAQWSKLCRTFGERAPGPFELYLPPSPERLAHVTSWEFHRMGIERQRARTLLVAARHHRHIERTVDLSGEDARNALMQLPGIGVWTAAVTVGVSHGDRDALPVGDFHVKNTVAWALTGRARGTDEEMIVTLEPYRPHRWVVVRMLERCGLSAPKFAPRRPLLPIERM
jgi:3-methyladenine DNA glycosylase/8-oxoguanine DNA glycosylase